MSDTPFHLMADPLIKLVPLTVNVNEALPAVALFGDKLLSVGSGLLAVMVNTCVALVPPPGRGVKTVTGTVPAALIFDAATTAVNCVGLINVVASGTPFQLTTEPVTKLLPVTVKVKAPLPAIAVLGLMAVVTGIGLLTMIVLIVKRSAALVPPPGAGVNTETAAVPAVAILAAGTTAVNCDELPKVVVSAMPFQFIVDPLIKPVPVMVMVKATSPANAAFGDIDNDTGAGLLVVPELLPPDESDLLQEMNNNKMIAKDSNLKTFIQLDL